METTLRLAIDGMHCQSCVRRVRRAIEGVDGVRVAAVDVGSAQIHAGPDAAEIVLSRLSDAGFVARIEPAPARGEGT